MRRKLEIGSETRKDCNADTPPPGSLGLRLWQGLQENKITKTTQGILLITTLRQLVLDFNDILIMDDSQTGQAADRAAITIRNRRTAANCGTIRMALRGATCRATYHAVASVGFRSHLYIGSYMQFSICRGVGGFEPSQFMFQPPQR